MADLDIEKIQTGEDYGAGPVVIAGKPFRESLPAQPNGKGEVRIDLTDLNAERVERRVWRGLPSRPSLEISTAHLSARAVRGNRLNFSL